MIYYLTAARLVGAMGLFLNTLGQSLAGRINILTYEEILAEKSLTLPRGAYIFTGLSGGLGSLDPPSPARQEICRLRGLLAAKFGTASVLNDPQSSLWRFPLLCRLHEQGINRFAAYRAGAMPHSARFPVFLREELGTKWDHTPLVRNLEEYEAALAATETSGRLLAVEFCDTADATGVYRKYGAFVVGARIVPRHLFLSRHWMVKEPDLTGPEHLAEELAYLDANPHAEALREVCRLANIGYGRIDYSLLDGRVQVWEINTTPSFVNASAVGDTVRQATNERFVEFFTAALDALETAAA